MTDEQKAKNEVADDIRAIALAATNNPIDAIEMLMAVIAGLMINTGNPCIYHAFGHFVTLAADMIRVADRVMKGNDL